MGVLGFDSNSSNQQTEYTSATGYGTIFGAGSSSHRASDNAKLSTGTSVMADSGSLALGAGAQLRTAPTINGAKNVTIGDPNAMSTAMAGVSDVAKNFTQALSDSSSSNAGLLSTALQKLSDLSLSAQTGGASAAGTTFTYLLLGGLALVALVLVTYFWKRR